MLLGILLLTLWMAGGGSRADLLAQVIVRSIAWGTLLAAVVIAPRLRPLRGEWVVALFLLAAGAIAALQLVPLPPGIWQSLPGRSLFADAAILSGQAQPWRPWSIVPGATFNALSSLVVPLTMLVLVTGLRHDERSRLPGILLGFIITATLIGLLQFSGARLNNPLLNDTPGEVAGVFANRNHFALLLAIGCVLAPVWAFIDRQGLRWRGPLALGGVLLFVLGIMASGSRAGLLLGAIALAAGCAIIARPVRHRLRRAPRWVFLTLVAGMIALASGLIAASIWAGRAVSIDRALTSNVEEDMRSRGLPLVIDMIGAYFPWGAGLGSFDTMFRLHEPLALLKPTYFNHAHNDWLEVVLDSGLAGAALLLAAILWWGWASLRAWRDQASIPRLGSAIVLLVMVASVFDYPARTPIIMALLLAAALWLSGCDTAPALPRKAQHL